MIPALRSGSRTFPRRTTSCPTRRPGGGTTHSGPISGRFRKTSPRRPGGGPGPGLAGQAPAARAGPADAAAPAQAPASATGTSRTCSAGWSAGGGGPIPGADQTAEIEVTVEEAYHGTRRTISLAGPGGTRTLDVTIPPGVTDGQRIRLAAQGGRGSDGAPPGDLYLIAVIAPDPVYRLEGRDLHVELRLAPPGAPPGAAG